MKYMAYTIYGGRIVHARSGWMDSPVEARVEGVKRMKDGEDIAVIDNETMSPFHIAARQQLPACPKVLRNGGYS